MLLLSTTMLLETSFDQFSITIYCIVSLKRGQRKFKHLIYNLSTAPPETKNSALLQNWKSLQLPLQTFPPLILPLLPGVTCHWKQIYFLLFILIFLIHLESAKLNGCLKYVFRLNLNSLIFICHSLHLNCFMLADIFFAKVLGILRRRSITLIFEPMKSSF